MGEYQDRGGQQADRGADQGQAGAGEGQDEELQAGAGGDDEESGEPANSVSETKPGDIVIYLMISLIFNTTGQCQKVHGKKIQSSFAKTRY